MIANPTSNGHDWTIDSVREALAAKRISARELTAEFLPAHRTAQSGAERLSGAFSRARLRASRRSRWTRLAGRSFARSRWPAAGGERRSQHQGRGDDLRLAHPRRLSAGLRRHGGRAPGTRRRDRAGQNQLRRVRHGRLERKLGLWPGAQSCGHGPRAGRLERRIGRGGGGGTGGGGVGHRHGRLGSPAGLVLRHSGDDADLRTRLALRADRVRLFARSRRAVRANRSAMWPKIMASDGGQ